MKTSLASSLTHWMLVFMMVVIVGVACLTGYGVYKAISIESNGDVSGFIYRVITDTPHPEKNIQKIPS